MLKFTTIKVGYIVSYDYNYLLTSIATLYDYVDKIVIAIDIESKTWSGNDFVIPESFFVAISTFDKRKIIEIYRDNFFVPYLGPMECETRERNLVLQKMGKGGWKLQLDVDEYIYDFKEVSRFLYRNWYFNVFPGITPMQFRGKLITLYKEIESGFLYIANNERFSFVTNGNQNKVARLHFDIPSYYTNISVIHQSWGRKKEEIIEKINNWGHRDDFDTLAYYDFWNQLNKDNYTNYKNFHPMRPELWDKLYLLESRDIDEFITKYSILHPQKIIHFNIVFLYNKIINKFLKK